MVMTVSTAPWPIGQLALPHAVADHLAAAELHLLAVGGEILLHLDDQVRIGEPHAVAGRWTKHIDIEAALHRVRHIGPQSLPMMS